jgi:hypothetical protein
MQATMQHNHLTNRSDSNWELQLLLHVENQDEIVAMKKIAFSRLLVWV